MTAASGSAKSAVRIVFWLVVVVAAVVVTAAVLRMNAATTPARVALITADGTAYWDRLIEGAEVAANEFDVQLTVQKADGTLDTQTDLMLNLLEQGYAGMAVSPVDAVKQGVALRRVAASSRLITVDSDSDLSGRICFVGADNYAAGRLCGELVKQALPEGGRVMIVMGPIDKANGERRRQGLIDELLDRSYGPGRPVEPLEEIHSGEQYSVVRTLIDEIDPEAAEANVLAALGEDSDVDCIVGLYGYSTPAALRAMASAGASGIKVIGFDDDAETLAGVADGRVFATIAQDQFNYGYHTVRLLADAASGKAQLSIPITERVHFPPLVVNQDNLETFRTGQR